MRSMLALVATLVFAFAGVPEASAEPEPVPMTPDDVVRLVEAGMGDDVIIAKIREGGETFSLSVDDLLALKDAGVSDAVLATMVRTNVEAKREAVRDEWEAYSDPRIEAGVALRWYSRPWRPRYVRYRSPFVTCYDPYPSWTFGYYGHSYGNIHVGGYGHYGGYNHYGGYDHHGGHGSWPYKSGNVRPKKTTGGRGGRR